MRDPAGVHGLTLGDDAETMERLGFAVSRDGSVAVGGLVLRCVGGGGGIRGWTLDGTAGPASLDGLPTRWAPAIPAAAVEHPNGATGVDHVVVFTDDRARTAAALEQGGGDLRRLAGPPSVPVPMAFVRLGGVVVEVAEAGPPTRFWGLVVVVEDLDTVTRSLGDAVGTPRDAVQPGRRIATVRPAAGLTTALAFMSPRPGG